MRTSIRIGCNVVPGLALLSMLPGCGGIIDQPAHQTFMNRLGATSVTVFPTFVREADQHCYDPAAAERIAEFLTDQHLASVTVSDHEVPITGEWGMNEARMLQSSAADLSSYVREHPPSTEYALLAECLIGGRNTVIGVHGYLVDTDGKVAYAMLLNSHWPVFSEVDPQDVADCTTVAIEKMRQDLVATPPNN